MGIGDMSIPIVGLEHIDQFLQEHTWVAVIMGMAHNAAQCALVAKKEDRKMTLRI